jgi:uncharacterized membrane protein YfcA
MVGNGEMQSRLAGQGVVLASVSSALINLPILYRTARNPALARKLAIVTVAVAVIGVAFLVLQRYPWRLLK